MQITKTHNKKRYSIKFNNPQMKVVKKGILERLIKAIEDGQVQEMITGFIKHNEIKVSDVTKQIYKSKKPGKNKNWLKSKIVKTKNGEPRIKVFYDGNWMSFWELAHTNKAINNDLAYTVLQYRWVNNQRSEEELFKPKTLRHTVKQHEFAQTGGLFEECDRELVQACLTGSNQELLKTKATREPYITPGEKRRMGL